jgi:hypothetical protein
LAPQTAIISAKNKENLTSFLLAFAIVNEAWVDMTVFSTTCEDWRWQSALSFHVLYVEPLTLINLEILE